MVAWSGTPVLCTLFQQPLLVSFVDQYVCFNNEVHLNLSEINFLLAISNQVNQSNHKMCVVNFSEQRALVSNSYLPSPKPGESHPIFKATSNHSMQLHLGMHLCLRKKVWMLLLVFVHNVGVLGPRAATQVYWGFPDGEKSVFHGNGRYRKISRLKSAPNRLGFLRPSAAGP